MIVKRNFSRRSGQRRNAFTLLEVLVVVAILVVLASVASVQVFKYLDEAKDDAARSSCQTLATAAQSYYAKEGQYPQSVQVLTPYLTDSSMIMDPWGQQFQLTQTTDPNSGSIVLEVHTQSPHGKYISSMRSKNTK